MSTKKELEEQVATAQRRIDAAETARETAESRRSTAVDAQQTAQNEAEAIGRERNRLLDVLRALRTHPDVGDTAREFIRQELGQ